ncbi:S8 family serine peptidase [Colwellia sp. PAMC 21821]|uniref:S8 family serine peptidase n=1 Tax=Colwellia sp. PAMC 21821 TaxID=1816219 RepID=UPI0009BD0DC7|nr:S8 family serine peptidase [Colwellia sp. PAMC 21821]ARD44861.1 hypothetical protein A3Q33_11430 [Colwellia sp. PAMC 21821]
MIDHKIPSYYSHNLKRLCSFFIAISVAISANAENVKVTSHEFNAKSIVSVNENYKKVIADNGKAIYIVRMNAPSVASYKGGIETFSATNPATLGVKSLNANSKASKQYSSFLKSKQVDLVEHCERAFGRKIDVKYKYQHAFNGVAMELDQQEAKALATLPNVISVTQERIEYPLTDAGPAWIGADKIWQGSHSNKHHGKHGKNHKMGSMGEGAVVAILDTGINHDHPSFADVGGDGYDHENPLGSGNYIPGSYCDTNPWFCNDKLIGAWDMVQTSADPNSPEDSDGHGSHTASTTAGNFVKPAVMFAPTADLSRDISGVAPHANIIIYDVCVDGCPGSALLAAIDQVVIDSANLPNGIQSLNYSISGGENPYSDAVELGFLNATAAGIYVAVSAGNSGPGPATVAHNSPWVSTTGAMTHNRKIENAVVDMTSDGDALANIFGKGFTSGYGPAPMVYAGNFPTANGSQNDTAPEQCLDPFPAGHFNGEIVVCDRGEIARTAKGANVLAGGAGGFVLANAAANGEAVVGDAHFLPGVHLGFTNGEILKNWLASNASTMGSIQGYSLNLDDANGDITAGFSSRGPNTTLDILKPDITAPGVDIMAAVNTDGVTPSPEFAFLSGTSMSSPHNAGSGALVSMLTDWTPYEIKSALMMTSKSNDLLKDDAMTPADPFDVGAGRVQLNKVLRSGLVLSETPENFLAADPDAGGDPRTLNIASMQESNCVRTCSWTRVVTHTGDRQGHWKLSGDSDTMQVSVSPKNISLRPGESATITITADTTLAPTGWNFGELKLAASGHHYVNLHMPIAVNTNRSSSANLSKTVDMASAKEGDVLNYEIKVTNGQLVDVIDITDMLPNGMSLVDGSVSSTITNGSEASAVSVNDGQIDWSVLLDVGGLELQQSPAPFGYFSLASFGVAPFGCPANCDDGAFILNIPLFDYNGQSYSSVIWSVNGTIEVGTASGAAASATSQSLPNASAPNNILAPFWADLNIGAGGNWYVAVLDAGPQQFTVYEWENVPFFGNPMTSTFQVWVETGTSNIWFVYADLPLLPVNLTVGIENDDGTVGASYFDNGAGTAPVPGVDLKVVSSTGGTATLNFQGEIDRCHKKHDNVKVNEVHINAGGTVAMAYAATTCETRGKGKRGRQH